MRSDQSELMRRDETKSTTRVTWQEKQVQILNFLIVFYKNTSIFINIPVCSGATLQRMAKQSHSSPPCPLKKAQKINFLNHYTDFVMALITMTSGSYARLWFWHWLYYETLIQKRNVLMNISEKDQLCSWLGFS